MPTATGPVRKTRVRKVWWFNPDAEGRVKRRRDPLATRAKGEPVFREDHDRFWRQVPADTTHRAEVVKRHPDGHEERVSTWENKGWIRAEQALMMSDKARETAPDELKALYPSYFEDGKKSAKAGESEAA